MRKTTAALHAYATCESGGAAQLHRLFVGAANHLAVLFARGGKAVKRRLVEDGGVAVLVEPLGKVQRQETADAFVGTSIPVPRKDLDNGGVVGQKEQVGETGAVHAEQQCGVVHQLHLLAKRVELGAKRKHVGGGKRRAQTVEHGVFVENGTRAAAQ